MRVSNGFVVAPNAVSIAVYDLAGRLLAAANASSLKLPEAAGVVLIKATDAAGAVSTLKTAI